MSLLEVRGVSKLFGGLRAVDSLDMVVEAGELHGLIGPNGAGKSTLLNLISGFAHPTSGSIVFDGQDVTLLPPHRIAELGVRRVFQHPQLFGAMSVLENTKVGAHQWLRSGILGAVLRDRDTQAEEARLNEDAIRQLSTFGLDVFGQSLARDLPFGHQRLLELTRALIGKPKLILLDEPLTGMTAVEARLVTDSIRELNARGLTILMVEHNVTAIAETCGRVTVLDFGRKIADGDPPSIRQNPLVIEAYLGKAE